MSGALGRWRDRVAQQLRDSGLNVVTAMDPGRAARWREAVAAVAVARSLGTALSIDAIHADEIPSTKGML